MNTTLGPEHPDYWIARWRERRTGWHKPTAHPLLQRWWDALAVRAGGRVLVPLAGASLDVAWLLGRGYQVDAVEVSEQAVADFFDQQGWVPEQRRLGEHVAWCHHALRFFVADFFDLDNHVLGRYGAIYDRAALIALDADSRARYADHLTGLAAADCRQLLITLEYPPWFRPGPPFSVGEDEVARLYGAVWQGEVLATCSENQRPQRERVYLLKRR